MGIESEKAGKQVNDLKQQKTNVKQYKNKLVLWYNVSSVGVKKDC